MAKVLFSTGEDSYRLYVNLSLEPVQSLTVLSGNMLDLWHTSMCKFSLLVYTRQDSNCLSVKVTCQRLAVVYKLLPQSLESSFAFSIASMLPCVDLNRRRQLQAVCKGQAAKDDCTDSHPCLEWMLVQRHVTYNSSEQADQFAHL